MSKPNDQNIDIIKQALGNLPLLDLPHNFHAEVMAKVRSTASMRSNRKRRSVFRLVGSFAASAAVVVAAVLIFDALPRQYGNLDHDIVAQVAFDEPTAGGAGLFGMDDADSAIYFAQPQMEVLPGGIAPTPQLWQTTEIETAEAQVFDNNMAVFDETSEHFAASFKIAIYVEDVDAALYEIQLLPGELRQWHMYADPDEGNRVEVTKAFAADDLEWVIGFLHNLGDVTHYDSTISDLRELEPTDEALPEAEADGVIVIKLFD